MGRPPVPRRIGCRFGGRGLRPIGRPARGLPVVALALDELEALRLADLEGLYHEVSAHRMGISRATFGRILASARGKVARALLEQCVLVVGEGPVIREDGAPCCEGRRRGRRWARIDGGAEASKTGEGISTDMETGSTKKGGSSS